MIDDTKPGRVTQGRGRQVSSEDAGGRDRRRAERQVSQSLAAVRIRNVKYTVTLCEVSRTGAQISIRQGLMPSVGQPVELEFINSTRSSAIVIWTEGSNVGLRFDEPLPDSSDVLHFDDMGSEYYRAILRLQSDAS